MLVLRYISPKKEVKDEEHQVAFLFTQDKKGSFLVRFVCRDFSYVP